MKPRIKPAFEVFVAVLCFLVLLGCSKKRGTLGSGVISSSMTVLSKDESNNTELVSPTQNILPEVSPVTSEDNPNNNSGDHDSFASVPQEVISFFEDYMEAGKKGLHSSEALSYCYYSPNSEFYRQMDETTPWFVLDYEIDQIEKINDGLYAFTVLTKKSASDAEDTSAGYYDRIFNFVGEIDGRQYIIKNIRDIPEALTEGLNPDLYSYEIPYSGNSDKPIRPIEAVTLDEVLSFSGETLSD